MPRQILKSQKRMHEKRTELLNAALQQGGLAEGLKFLNATVDHRYTGLYALQGGTLVNVGLHDRGGHVDTGQLQPAPLVTSLSPLILEDLPYVSVPRMYQHCVPVADGRGVLLGTLCHFDHERRELPDEEFVFLEAAAGLMARYLPGA